MNTDRVNAGLVCEKDFCNEFIFDHCDICKSDFCRQCMNNHDCGQSSSSAVSSSESLEETAYSVSYEEIRERLNESINTAHSMSSMFHTHMPYLITDEGESASSQIFPANSHSSASAITVQRLPVALVLEKAKGKKRFIEKNTIQKESLKKFYSQDNATRYDAKVIKLIPVQSSGISSWVWVHFSKINLKLHPELRDNAACTHCLEASKFNPDISFIVPYTVSNMSSHILTFLSSCT